MKTQFLKNPSWSILALIMTMVFTSCTPSYEEALKKFEEGNEYDAVEIMHKLADKGDDQAIDWLTEYYLKEYKDRPTTYKETNSDVYLNRVISIFEIVASDWATNEPASRLAEIYSVSMLKDKAKAEKWAKVGAERGDPYSLNLLGLSYSEKRDYKQALPLLEKAASSNYKDAILYLYKFYSNPSNSFADASKASIYCKKAAEYGDPQAKYAMAKRYYYGEGVEKNIVTAHNFIVNLPNAYILDKDLPSAIDKDYKAELQRQEAQAKADRLNRAREILNGGTTWQYKEDGGVTYRLRFCSNHILAFERNDLYDHEKNYSVSLKYTANLSDPLEPRLSFTSYVDYDGVSPDWIQEVFGGTIMKFSVSGNTMTVSGNHVINGTYTQRTR